jgi:hypothetical protein
MVGYLTQLRWLRKGILVTAAWPAAAGAIPLAQAAAEVRAAWAALDKHQDGFWLDTQPSSAALLDRWYSALRAWSAVEIESGRATTLDADAAGLDKAFGAKAFPLGGGAWLVAAGNGSFGTVFALKPQAGHLAEAWSLAAPQPGRYPALAAWRANRSRPLCEGQEGCGPLTASVQLLPAEADGSARFLVLGTYTFPMGATVGGHLSVWRWRPAGAEPLLVKTFGFMIDDAALLPIEGSLLRLRAKDGWKHLFACGGCSGRQVEWRWRLAGKSVESLGSRSLVPELDLVDSLIDRIAAKRKAADLAEPAAVQAVRRLLEGNGDPGPIGTSPGGMLNGWTRRTMGSHILVCLSADSIGSATYTFSRAAGRLRLVRVVPRRETKNPCGKGARS